MPKKISRKHAATLDRMGFSTLKIGNAKKREKDLAMRNRKGRN